MACCCGLQKKNKSSDGGEQKNGGGDSITVVLKADLHCEGCVSKIYKTINSYDGESLSPCLSILLVMLIRSVICFSSELLQPLSS